MPKFDVLIEPKDCALVLLDQQAGLAFGIGSIDRQMLLNNVIALARAAKVFDLPIVASTSATKVYSGPLMPAVQAARRPRPSQYECMGGRCRAGRH